jgi:hypothetical protein
LDAARPLLEFVKDVIDSEQLEHLGLIPKFEALSYAWGEPGDEGTIIVNGMTLSIRKNLYDALHHLRHTGNSLFLEKRTLWINKISIGNST